MCCAERVKSFVLVGDAVWMETGILVRLRRMILRSFAGVRKTEQETSMSCYTARIARADVSIYLPCYTARNARADMSVY